MARTKVGEHVRASEDGSEALSQGSDHRAVAGGVKEHAVGALDVVASAKGGKGGVGGSGAAGGADEGGVLLRSRRREGKKVESEGGGKSGGGLEGEERGGGVGEEVGNRNAAPKGEGASGNAAVKETCAATRGGGVIQGQERQRRDDCRGSSLSVWVARLVEVVQVREEEGGGSRAVEVVSTGTEGCGDWGGAAVREGGVEVGKGGRGGKEGGATGCGSGVGGREAAPRESHRALVGEATPSPYACELAAAERGQPRSGVVPDGSP